MSSNKLIGTEIVLQLALFLLNAAWQMLQHLVNFVTISGRVSRGSAYVAQSLRVRLFSSASSKPLNSRSRLISYITDIEGDGHYFDRFVENSKVLSFEDVEPDLRPNSVDYFPYTKQVVFLPTSDHDGKDVEPQFLNDDGVDMTHSILVCGGDMWDKGGNDLYVLRQMLSLQERFKGRVHFILGNRDINKMRVLQEMGITSKSSSPSLPFHKGVYWFKGTGLQGDPELISKYLTDKNESNDDDDSSNVLVPTSPPARLQWMLKKTMGSPDAFELRRNELAQEREFLMSFEAEMSPSKRHGEVESPIVSDVDVVESYRLSCHTDGIMGKYLARSALCMQIGSAMFMHGSLPITPTVVSAFEEKYDDGTNGKSKESFWSFLHTYTTPFIQKREKPDGTNTKDEWLKSFNIFTKRQIEAWKNNVTLAETGSLDNKNNELETCWSHVGGYQHNTNETEIGTNFGSLCQYGMGWLPNKIQNPSLVYNSWITNGLPRKLYEKKPEDLSYQNLVKDFFTYAELDVIVTGHQPVGDIPFPIQVDMDEEGMKGKKFIVCGDTSYSGDSQWMTDGRKNLGRGGSVSGRGDVAVSEILLEQECTEGGNISSITCHGVMSDGTPYESINFLGEEGSMVGKLVDRGQMTFEGSVQDDSCEEMDWFVKSKFKDSTYLVSTSKGYEVFNSIARLKSDERRT